MYVNPFFAGCVSTILVEVAIIIVVFATNIVTVKEITPKDEQDDKY
mgnify:CR=1 FL=1